MYLFTQVVNHHLLNDLTELGLWNDDMKNEIISQGGSIQVSLKWEWYGDGIPVNVHVHMEIHINLGIWLKTSGDTN